ncbi:hypothetical protein PAMA_016550 [Pampus argenteus]
MFLMRTFATCLLMAFLVQQVSPSTKLRKQRPADRAVSSASGGAQKSGASAAIRSGKFSTNNNMQCEWEARNVGNTVKLSVKCENPEARIKGGVTDLNCDYIGKPQKCNRYAPSSRTFWKQLSRALIKLQDKLCTDERALVKPGLCKRAHKDSHFKLDVGSSVVSAQSGSRHEPSLPPPSPQPNSTSTSTACTKRADHRQTAEEYCNSSWASVCSFFFSMVQSNEC